MAIPRGLVNEHLNGRSISQDKHEESIDLDNLGEVRELPPKIPNGDYTVAFMKSEHGSFAGKDRLFIWFVIVDGDYRGKHMYLCCPIPKKKASGQRKLALGSKLVDTWSVATGRMPIRTDRLSIKVFRNLYFKATVRPWRKISGAD